jgi:predicted RND superfamily exporter protein
LRIGRDLREEVDRKWDEALYAIGRFEGGRFSRLIFNISSEVTGDEAAYVVKALRQNLSRYYGEYYVLGSSANMCDIRDTFSTDIVNINAINILAVFIIIMLLYRSVSIPLLLVACIQGAIFVSLSLNVATRSPVYFVCYLVAICIQMGATIDYGILLTDRYCAFRRKLAPSEAVKEAVCVSSPTILTSGLVFVIAAAIVGLMATVPIISHIGRLISQGAAVSVLTVLLILPQCLRLFDGFIERGSLRGKFKREG